MSIEAIVLALHHSRSRGTDKLVLIGIANHDGDGGSWPSLETLGKYASCGLTRTKQAVKALVALGEVSVKLHAGGKKETRNDRRPNLYEVILSCPSDCDGTKNHRILKTTVTPSAPRKNVDDSHFSGPRQSLLESTTVTPSVSEPSLEPSIRNALVDSSFEALWATYPRKVGKASARRAFDKMSRIKDTPSIEMLIEAVKSYAATVTDMKYCAHLATWLNGQRWADEIVETSTVPDPVSEQMMNAIRIGASHGLAGYSEQQLHDATEHLTEPERQSAFDAYRQRRHTHAINVAI